MTDDAELLRKYVQAGSEDAFEELVQRHLPVVYSSALRQTDGDVELAKDICQTVFIDFGRKAGSLLGHELLIGWLFSATRFTAATVLRANRRRQIRERIAISMHEDAATPALECRDPQLASALDAAMEELTSEDRNAVLLRFFQGKDLKDVGAALGITEDAARMRVTRAIGKLHSLLESRGVTVSAAALGSILATEAVTAVPAGLATTISAAALSGATITTTAVIAATNAIAMTTLQKSMLAVVLAVVGSAGIYQTYEASSLRNRLQRLQRQDTDLVQQLKAERDEATNRLALVAAENARLIRDHSNAELLRLRGDLARLRNAVDERSNDPMASVSKQVARRINEIMKWIEQTPGEYIPELRLLSAQDLLGYATHFPDIKKELDLRFGASRLRLSAKTAFCSTLGFALQDFLLAHDGELPHDLSELKPFCRSQADDDMLQRYELLHSGNIRDYPQTEPFIAEKDAPELGSTTPALKSMSSAIATNPST